MSTPIVIVTGPPASGKSTLALRLADDLALPSITKDGIKETLLDAAGEVGVEESKRLGRAAGLCSGTCSRRSSLHGVPRSSRGISAPSMQIRA